MARIPILFVQGSAERAGAERMLFYLLKFLDRDSFEARVAFLAEGPFISEVEDLGVEVIRLGLGGRLRDVFRWPGTVSSIADAIASTSSRIVHANGEKMSIFSARAARRAGVPSVSWLHDAPGAGGAAGTAAQLVLSRSRSDAVVTCSRWLADEFNLRMQMRATTILNGLDLSDLPSDDGSLEKLAAGLGWPKGAAVIAHFTRLQRWKGTDVFVRAAAKTVEDHPAARFLVVGGALYGRETDFLDELEGLRSSLGLEKVLSFAGYRPDALQLMSGCDIVVHCSVEPDPFPTVVLEGMALGKPVVATRTRGPEEALGEETGVLVAPGDPDELSRALGRLLSDRKTASDLGKYAKERAFGSFKAERMAREFEDLYRNLLRL